MFVSPAVDLVVVAALFTVITQTLQSVLTDRKALRNAQKEMKEKQKRYQEMIKKGNAANPADTENAQKEMMEMMQMSMKSMPKLMIANMIVFIPLYAMVSNVYHGMTVPLYPPFSWVWPQADWFWYYVLNSLIISLAVNHVINWYFARKENHEKKLEGMKTNAQ